MTLAKHWEELTMMNTPPEIASEFIKKYRGSYLWFIAKGRDPVLCLSKGVDEETDEKTFVFRSELFGTITCKLNSDVVLQAKFPKTSLFNWGEKNMGHCYRLPARQYRRAPTLENCYLHDPAQDFFTHFEKIKTNKISENILLSAFAGQYTPFQEAIHLLNSDKVHSRAISRWFGLSKGLDKDKKILWYLDRPIGFATENSIQVKVPELKQEVYDFIKRNSLSVTLL